MSSRISHIPFFERAVIPDWTLLAAGLLYAIPTVLLLSWRFNIGVIFAAAPFIFLLACHGPSCIYLLIPASFLFLPYEGFITILPVDFMAILLVAAYGIDLLRGRKRSLPNPIARPYLLYLLAILVSIALEEFTPLSIRFFLRQILLFGAFMAVAHFSDRVRIKHLFIIFVASALLNSSYSLMQFLGAGGGIRAFGLAGRGYADHVMIGFLICAVYYLWSEDLRERFFWAISALIMVGAIAATQTRASVITAAFGLVVILFSGLKAGRRITFRVPRKNLIIAIFLAFVTIVLLVLYTPVFDGIVHRFGRIGLHASGTILLRLSLWTASIKAFLANPFFGIGAGNFPTIYAWVPEVRFDPIFYMVEGMSTHAILMTALSETGLFGLVTISWFYFRTIRVSHTILANSETAADSAATLALFAIAACVLFSSIYAGAWFWGNNSYHMALFFGLIAAFRHQQKSIVSERPSA